MGLQEQLKNNKMELLNNIQRIKGLISEQLPKNQSSSGLPPKPSGLPPKPATPKQQTGVDLSKQRIEDIKIARGTNWVKKIEKFNPLSDSFEIFYKDKSYSRVYPSGRFISVDSLPGGRKAMGTYNTDWDGTYDDASTTYKRFKDQAWLDDDEQKQLGIKWNANTKKYEKINQSNPKPDNTQTSSESTYTICSETLPVKKFCKNQIVKDVQRCLRDKHQMSLKDDGKFGPKTEKALIKLGLKGNVITSKEYNIACSPTDLGQSSKPNTTGYDDYSNDEYEDSSEKPEQEYSTGYEDYTLEEN
jgi:hypothetical protein